ncbi:uncharacterized protein F4822DRAFT_402956 [Hypoxylon trugodes]|uniref:uncharacterized protein n=1 Tax=Hypoxylon trugodes TaxID=326681 RepID=UPI00218CD0DD|nr:uncharacterized protein F4822DRAFT_402956 [Hypoxylon trugodes]KAI1388479.1 hypothetical protein F4822DRAFT_402956 [Hypoxylon trugodes]
MSYYYCNKRKRLFNHLFFFFLITLAMLASQMFSYRWVDSWLRKRMITESWTSPSAVYHFPFLRVLAFPIIFFFLLSFDVCGDLPIPGAFSYHLHA